MIHQIFLFCATVVLCSHGLQQNRGFSSQRVFSRHTAINMNSESQVSFFDKLKKTLLPIALGASIMVGDPMNADAARSGGRSGGSSFRSSPSPRSSTAQRSSSSGYSGQSSYQSRPNINIMPVMPMYSPFGYGFSPFAFNPFGFIPINLNFILLGGVAYAVYSVLKNRTGGSDFSNSEDAGSLGSGATVMKVQIALDSNWEERNNIMGTLATLAEKNGAMSGREDIAKLLSEASLALLRKQGDWNSVAYEGELFRSGGQQAEPAFQKLAIKERAKFEEETSSIATIRASSTGSTPTQVVVSIVVALRGKSSAYLPSNLRSISDLSTCLQGLAADAMTDDGNNVMAVEVRVRVRVKVRVKANVYDPKDSNPDLNLNLTLGAMDPIRARDDHLAQRTDRRLP